MLTVVADTCNGGGSSAQHSRTQRSGRLPLAHREHYGFNTNTCRALSVHCLHGCFRQAALCMTTGMHTVAGPGLRPVLKEATCRLQLTKSRHAISAYKRTISFAHDFQL